LVAAANVAKADVQALVAGYVDLARANGAEPPERVRGHVAAEIKKLAVEGYPAETIEAALRLMFERRLHPSVLPSLLVEVQAGPRRDREHPADRMARVLREAGMRDTSRIDDIDGDAYEIADEDDH
jgi:hypothetical protein